MQQISINLTAVLEVLIYKPAKIVELSTNKVAIETTIKGKHIKQKKHTPIPRACNWDTCRILGIKSSCLTFQAPEDIAEDDFSGRSTFCSHSRIGSSLKQNYTKSARWIVIAWRTIGALQEDTFPSPGEFQSWPASVGTICPGQRRWIWGECCKTEPGRHRQTIPVSRIDQCFSVTCESTDSWICFYALILGTENTEFEMCFIKIVMSKYCFCNSLTPKMFY